MKILHFMLILSGIIITSCTSTHEPVFAHAETLTQELMPLTGVTSPIRLEIKHPFLIVLNSDRTDSLFHVYDLYQHELKSAFGISGRGPNEFMAPYLFNTQFPDVFISDYNQNGNIIYRFNLDKEGQPIISKDKKRPNYIDGVFGAVFINDSLFVRDNSATFRSLELQLLNFEDESPRKTWKYGDPYIAPNLINNDPDRGWVYANESRVVFCYKYKKRIDFMDADLNHIKSVDFEYSCPANITQGDDVKLSYRAGYLGKRYLYTIFLGKSWDEFMDLSFRESILEVFDLDGNPVIKYHLNGLTPFHFVVDEETFTLYGHCDGRAETEDHLLMYKLKGLQ